MHQMATRRGGRELLSSEVVLEGPGVHVVADVVASPKRGIAGVYPQNGYYSSNIRGNNFWGKKVGKNGGWRYF